MGFKFIYTDSRTNRHCIRFRGGYTSGYMSAPRLARFPRERRRASRLRVCRLTCTYEAPDGSGTLYHLHPELVDEGAGPADAPTVMLCRECNEAVKEKKASPPELSIAAGVDFGAPHRLVPIAGSSALGSPPKSLSPLSMLPPILTRTASLVVSAP